MIFGTYGSLRMDQHTSCHSITAPNETPIFPMACIIEDLAGSDVPSRVAQGCIDLVGHSNILCLLANKVTP